MTESRLPAPLANTVNVACFRLSIGRTTLYNLLASGEIQAIKIGRSTLIPESELQRFIDDRVKAGASQ